RRCPVATVQYRWGRSDRRRPNWYRRQVQWGFHCSILRPERDPRDLRVNCWWRLRPYWGFPCHERNPAPGRLPESRPIHPRPRPAWDWFPALPEFQFEDRESRVAIDGWPAAAAESW